MTALTGAMPADSALQLTFGKSPYARSQLEIEAVPLHYYQSLRGGNRMVIYG